MQNMVAIDVPRNREAASTLQLRETFAVVIDKTEGKFPGTRLTGKEKNSSLSAFDHWTTFT